MGVSKNSGTSKSSILIGISIINHPFWGTPIFGNTHVYIYRDTSSLYLYEADNAWTSTSEHPYPAGQPPKAAVPCKVFSGTRQPPCLA